MKLDPFSWLSIYVFVSVRSSTWWFSYNFRRYSKWFYMLICPSVPCCQRRWFLTRTTRTLCLDPNSLTRGEKEKSHVVTLKTPSFICTASSCNVRICGFLFALCFCGTVLDMYMTWLTESDILNLEEYVRLRNVWPASHIKHIRYMSTKSYPVIYPYFGLNGVEHKALLKQLGTCSYVAVRRFCAVRCLIIICLSLLFSNYSAYVFLIFFLYSFLVLYVRFLFCVFCFLCFLCIFSPFVYSCPFPNSVQVYRPLPPGGNPIAVNK